MTHFVLLIDILKIHLTDFQYPEFANTIATLIKTLTLFTRQSAEFFIPIHSRHEPLSLATKMS